MVPISHLKSDVREDPWATILTDMSAPAPDRGLPETHRADCPFCQNRRIEATTKMSVVGDSIRLLHQCVRCLNRFWIVLPLPAPLGITLSPPLAPLAAIARAAGKGEERGEPSRTHAEPIAASTLHGARHASTHGYSPSRDRSQSMSALR